MVFICRHIFPVRYSYVKIYGFNSTSAVWRIRLCSSLNVLDLEKFLVKCEKLYLCQVSNFFFNGQKGQVYAIQILLP